MRGKAKALSKVSTTVRITPAYAGKSQPSQLPEKLCWDHPRLCGEKKEAERKLNYDRGSPPPMRGKVNFFEFFRCLTRITPAYAGKSHTFAASCYCIQDHPRLCGEKFSIFHRRHFKTGSPPPMRGKVFFQRNHGFCTRITPAYAGKRDREIVAVFIVWDHPRLCGEKKRLFWLLEHDQGSPPPMRGKGKFHGSCLRITWDHPRLCGEK